MHKIVGHHHAKKKLINHLSLQSWLIRGKKGIGKATLVEAFSTWFLIKHSRFISQLSENALFMHQEVTDINIMQKYNKKEESLLNHISAEIAIDLHVIQGTTIGVDKIRNMRKFLYFRSIQSEYKIAIIDSLEAMTENAKNAILKILEEPPQYSKIFIISHKICDIYTAIHCRCFHLNLLPLTDNETRIIVSSYCNFDDKIFNQMITIFPGMPGVIIKILNNNTYEIYKDFYHLLHNINNADIMTQIINSDIELELASYIIQRHILSNIKSSTQNSVLLLHHWKKIERLFTIAQRYHLDKKHVLANVVNIMTS
ncbi:DNA polymerase III subunit delta' [Wolbachia endosymbiont of Howardula sp.]|uniref:DNA polymerase III subunit delta' n=1 Tax=Wolbachia endosymbiont of Howardula sp. TaxID=2916816 RepID=UPI00397D73E9